MSQTSPITRPHPALADYLLLFGLAALWGGSFTFIKMGVETVPAVTTTLLRLLIATALILALAYWRGERLPRGGRIWRVVLATAITGNAVPFTLISWGEERIDSGLAAILMGIMPLTTMLIAHAVTVDDRLTPGKIAGIVLGFIGLVILIGPARLTSLGGDVIRELAVADHLREITMNRSHMCGRDVGERRRGECTSLFSHQRCGNGHTLCTSPTPRASLSAGHDAIWTSVVGHLPGGRHVHSPSRDASLSARSINEWIRGRASLRRNTCRCPVLGFSPSSPARSSASPMA